MFVKKSTSRLCENPLVQANQIYINAYTPPVVLGTSFSLIRIFTVSELQNLFWIDPNLDPTN